MIKVMGMYKRRADLTPEQFRDYYENQHMPLVRSLLPGMASHKRNYIRAGEKANVTFDVITEILYDTPESLALVRTALKDPAVRTRIQDDEANFMDQGAGITCVVDEVSGALIPNPPAG